MEIESLSRRCKFSEAAFIHLCKTLSPLPDPSSITMGQKPAPELQYQADRIKELQEHVKDLESELSQLKNQDITVRRLEKRIQEMESQNRSDFQAVEEDFKRRVEESRQGYIMQIEKWKGEVGTGLERCKCLEAEISDMHATMASDRQQSENALKSSFDEISHLTNEIDILQNKLVSQSGGNMSSAASELYKELLESSEERIISLEAEIKRLEALMSSQTSATQDHQGYLERLAQDIQREKDEAVMELERLKANLANCLGAPAVTTSDALISELKVCLDNHEQEASSRRHEAEDAVTRLNQLAVELEVKSQEIEALKQIQPVQQAFSDEVVGTGRSSGDVASIIQAQKDRLRLKVIELENERDNLKQSHVDLANKLQGMTADRNRIEAERNFWKTNRREAGDVELGSMGSSPAPVLAKRRQTVEPNGPEQHLTSLLVWGLGNPITRRLGLGYLLTLHLLVFMVLYRLSSIVSSSQ